MDRTPQQIFWLILLLIVAITVTLLYRLILAVGIAFTKGEARERWRRTFKEQGISLTAAVGLAICIIGSITSFVFKTNLGFIFFPFLIIFFVVLANSTGGARTARRLTARIIPPNEQTVDDVRVLSPRSINDEFQAQKKVERVRTCVYSLLLIVGAITGVILFMVMIAGGFS